jgi:bifunctional DNase/RNase
VDTKVKLRVQGLTNSQIQSGTYALVLAEENGPRRIPIIVGMAEAQSIALALEHIVPPRPLAHDLLFAFFRTFDIHLLEVYIYKFEEGIFFSELLFEKEGQQSRIDSRTSDAIAIALRVKCNIYASEKIVRECGIELDEPSTYEEDEEDLMYNPGPEDIADEMQLGKWLSLLDYSDLKSRLEDAVTHEDYEHAKIYRDELRRREKEGGYEK